jgi:DNA polymerase II large subunit
MINHRGPTVNLRIFTKQKIFATKIRNGVRTSPITGKSTHCSSHTHRWLDL